MYLGESQRGERRLGGNLDYDGASCCETGSHIAEKGDILSLGEGRKQTGKGRSRCTYAGPILRPIMALGNWSNRIEIMFSMQMVSITFWHRTGL
jgi:hypothetical protein